MAKNWRDTTPSDLDIPPPSKGTREPRTAWRNVLLLAIGAMFGLAVGEVRLRTYGVTVDSTFAMAQQEVRRLTDENARIGRQLRDVSTVESGTRSALKDAQRRLDETERNAKSTASTLMKTQESLRAAESKTDALTKELTDLKDENRNLTAQLNALKKAKSPQKQP